MWVVVIGIFQRLGVYTGYVGTEQERNMNVGQ